MDFLCFNFAVNFKMQHTSVANNALHTLNPEDYEFREADTRSIFMNEMPKRPRTGEAEKV